MARIGHGFLPKLRRSGGEASLRYRREFGKRRRAPTRELLKLLGGRAPENGSPVRRGLQVTLRCRGGGPARLSVKPGKVTRVRVRTRLSRGEALTLDVRFAPEMVGSEPAAPCDLQLSPVPKRSASPREGTIMTCGNAALDLVFRQAEADLQALELGLVGPEAPAAGAGSVLLGGVPRYVGIFSRDALIAASHAALCSTTYLEETLVRTAAYQGVRSDPWRDEEPGRLHHERRLSPQSCVGKRNRELYYGDSLGTPFWIHLLAEAFRWRGETGVLYRNAPTLRRATAWLLRKLDQGRGLLFYESRSSHGNQNQGWKDSNDAIVDGRGRVLAAPLATVELQGYAYLALIDGAAIHQLLGDVGEASMLRSVAAALKVRFNDTFWNPKTGFYLLAVDGQGRRADSVTSNPAHCLGTGIVDRGRKRLVLRRLAREDLFSGWGIRTLSSRNPSYDPFSYHRGSVWPVDNAFVACNLREAGEDQLAARIIGAQLAAATCFPRMRLPETLSGHPRSEEHPTPGLYPESNLVQAWSVTAIYSFVQTILGIRPRADRGLVLVDPDLPDWIPWVELSRFRVGDSTLDLRFWRDGAGRSRWAARIRDGAVRVVERPYLSDRHSGNLVSPWGSAV